MYALWPLAEAWPVGVEKLSWRAYYGQHEMAVRYIFGACEALYKECVL